MNSNMLTMAGAWLFIASLSCPDEQRAERAARYASA